MKYIVLAFFLLLPSMVVAQTDPATAGKQAENFVRSLGDEAISILDTTRNNPDTRREEFKRILNAKFDMDTIARFAMGRYWNIATESEKKEYTDHFLVN